MREILQHSPNTHSRTVEINLLTNKVNIIVGATAHSEINYNWKEMRSAWTPDRIKIEVNRSQIGAEGLTEKALGLYGNNLPGLAAMTSDIATICPLIKQHKSITNSKFYLVTQVKTNSYKF